MSVSQRTLAFDLLVGRAGELLYRLFEKWDIAPVSLLNSSSKIKQQQNSKHCWCFTFFQIKTTVPFIAFHMLLSPDLDCRVQPEEFLCLLNLALSSDECICNARSYNTGICS